MGRKMDIPGFTAHSDQVFVSLPAETTGQAPPDHPQTVVIFGWGDALPKHISKYSEGYRRLFPHARQVVILSPILKAVWSDVHARSRAMKPVLDAAFGAQPAADGSRVLLHAMSNAGGINCASALHRYRADHGAPLPHRLLVLDSTPGSPYLTLPVLAKWSRAMALGAAPYFPWPFAVTQAVCALFLGAHRLFERLVGRESASVFSCGAINDASLEAPDAHRLYLYSKEDDLIDWTDVEEHAAEGKRLGYEVEGAMFEGSGHVGHMRQFPDKYWALIQQAWARAEKPSS